jgi:hypothetical protein
MFSPPNYNSTFSTTSPDMDSEKNDANANGRDEYLSAATKYDNQQKKSLGL